MSTFINVTQIGSGGFGEVWICKSANDETSYAKKVLQDDIDEDGIRRFQREVRILDSLDHPNVINVVSKQLHTKPYYYVMPLYRKSLRDELESLINDENRINKIFTRILNAIEYAHQQGVIHRDLKPENVLLNSDTDLVVTDFGLGRILDAESTRLTQSGYRMGTPLYMAPEQLTNAKEADERADVFSLGRMLYELYTGPLTSSVQDQSLLPQGASLIVSRCTYNDPSKRFQTITELKRAWISLFDKTLHDDELDELVQLRAELALPENLNKDKVSRFLELITLHQDNSDLLHETIMKLRPNVFEQMVALNPELTREIIKNFVDFTSNQGWAFSYTDEIGNQCQKLFYATQDYEIRALLILCTLQVGINHNRWHVLGIFSKLLEDEKQPGEDIPLVEKLKSVHELARKDAAEYLALQDIHPAIRPLFEFDDITNDKLKF